MRPPRAPHTRTRPGRRRLCIGGAAVAVALLAGACDTSPVAASVNGAEIKQTALDQQIRLETANRAYVAAVNSQAASQGSGASIGGDAPGTYSARYVAGVLTSMIQAQAVHQRLAAERRQPGAAELAAARSVDEAIFGAGSTSRQALWLSFPQAFRDTQVAQDAEHASLEQVPTRAGAAQLRQAYQQNLRYFFAQVCVRTIAVAVTTAGSLDEAASAAKARSVAEQFNLGASDPQLRLRLGTPQGGQVACYDGAQLEAQGEALFGEVLALAPGYASAPQQTSFGYQVVEVDSRLEQPFGAAVEKALALGITEVQGSADPTYEAVVSGARVTVDPQYGSWNGRDLAVVPSSPLGANSSAATGQGATGATGSSGTGSQSGG